MTPSHPNAALPDVAHEAAAMARTLDWVGMDGIALPLLVDDGDGGSVRVAAQADVAVNLARAEARGIHMSRLYLLLQQAFVQQALSPAGMGEVLQQFMQSQDGASTHARLRLSFGQLLLRPALASDNAGWKQYPVCIEAEYGDAGLRVWLSVTVEYSSTCPASAALSRQINARQFAAQFAGSERIGSEDAVNWIASPQGLAATPHAQRSEARLRLQLSADAPAFDVRGVVDAVEQALATPVQTAVKREDEQAFARANAENLMFCEDAARRLAAVLCQLPHVQHFEATAAHLESLHAHDAVARVSGAGRAAAPA